MGLKVKGKSKPWWVFIVHNGQRTSRRVGDKKAAEMVASKIQAKLQLWEFSFEQEKPEPTFGEYAESWINVTVPAKCNWSTVENSKFILDRFVLPEFKDTKVKDIKRGMIKDCLLSKINGGYSNSYVKHMKNAVSDPLNKAVDDEIIPANPASSLGKLFKNEDTKPKIHPYSAKEIRQLLNAFSEHCPEHYPLVLLLARTGMRIGEALATRWVDINFEKRTIEVKRGLY